MKKSNELNNNTLAVFLCLCDAIFQSLEFDFDGFSSSTFSHQ